ncbi:phosphotriesterase-related protein [Clostridiaceae bacterium M8S5]|nr:phosphotriesterase-related protein [Clostridiaceae bacterium M8S5]
METVRGNIDIEGIKAVYIHEHLKIDLSAQKKDEDARFDQSELVISEMKELVSKGIDTIVEVTNMGMGRDIEAIRYICNESGINVVVSTGFYKEPFLPTYVYSMKEEDISKILVKEIVKGIDNTNIKAGMIGEVGTGKGQMSEIEMKIMKSCALAHVETGIPIYTHTTLGTLALEQLKLLKNTGVNLQKVVIGHMDLNPSIEYLSKVADTGCFLGFDTIGKIKYQPDEYRIKAIIQLIKRGHLNQIVLSQDLTRKSHLKANGGIGYSYLVDTFIPQMLKAGISQTQIDCMLKNNPKRLFI